MKGWDYQAAFSRNLGLVTAEEQERLRQTCVAIAGMGGVGGVHLVTLARLGVGAFHLADMDFFEMANFNRQYGATLGTIERSKVDVMSEIVREINSDVKLTCFPGGSRWKIAASSSREAISFLTASTSSRSKHAVRCFEPHVRKDSML